MANASREAINATRENSGIVRFDDNQVRVEWTDEVPLEADKLIRDCSWLIQPASARENKFIIFKQ